MLKATFKKREIISRFSSFIKMEISCTTSQKIYDIWFFIYTLQVSVGFQS